MRHGFTIQHRRLLYKLKDMKCTFSYFPLFAGSVKVVCGRFRQVRCSATMSKPRVLITSNEIPEAALNLLRDAKCDLTIMDDPFASRESVLQQIPGHDAVLIISHSSLVNSEFLNIAGPKLKVVATMSAGYDHLDLPEIKRRGIKVGNTPKVLSEAVAETAVLLILAAARRLHEGRLNIEQGKVEKGIWLMLGQDIRGSTVGVVGLGNIGQEIVKRLQGFGVGKFVYTGHSKKKAGDDLGATFVSLNDLLEQSDFVINAVPLNNETRGMFNEAAFNKMKKNAVFVNIGRGQTVVTDSLVKALKEGKIFAAGLDVVDPEPLPTDHELLKLPNAVLLPHLGSSTLKTRTDMAMAAVQNIVNGLSGKPLLYEL